MINIEELGWDANTVGELDHRLLKAPSVKLRSARTGKQGDTIYCIDLRITRPNADEYLSATELHSFEHFLLEGFQRHLPESFISVGIMGCQTGFYLSFLNEGRTEKICSALENILTGMLGATLVPYARIDQCGNYRNHSLELAQNLARRVLETKSNWLEAV